MVPPDPMGTIAITQPSLPEIPSATISSSSSSSRPSLLSTPSSRILLITDRIPPTESSLPFSLPLADPDFPRRVAPSTATAASPPSVQEPYLTMPPANTPLVRCLSPVRQSRLVEFPGNSPLAARGGSRTLRVGRPWLHRILKKNVIETQPDPL
ncbi:hypothetical protein BDV59DRAFT_111157 [Aspergillus ambiguus]|uniref:uncharacterized protein n=1 Tax=Aspergillus ambiguus TaxID=176160 RepID=UPI003CCDC3A7